MPAAAGLEASPSPSVVLFLQSELKAQQVVPSQARIDAAEGT